MLLLAVAQFILPESVNTVAAPFRSGSGDVNNVSLAINVDWGGEYLPDILAALDEEGVKATFFLTGRWTDENPQLAALIAEAGHELGNHGYNHTSPNDSTKQQIIEDIAKTEKSIFNATGVTTKLYAPPSGEEESHVAEAAEEAGYAMILWSVDTIDWQKPTAQTIIERVEKKIAPGAIILAHPTASTAEALPDIIYNLKQKGYIFVPVSENIGL